MSHAAGHDESETIPPTTTMPSNDRSDDDGAGDGGGAVATGSTLSPWKRTYLRASGGGFERLVNLLLDNKIFILNMFNGDASFDPTIDTLGLTAQVAGGLGTGTGADDSPTALGFEMVDLTSERGRESIARYLYSTTTNASGRATKWNDLNAEEKANAVSKEEIDNAIGTNRYLYQSPYKPEYDAPFVNQQAAESDYIGLVASFDGTPQGDVRTIEEALSGLSLDRPSLNNKMTNLARENNDYYRGVQAQLSMLGYYGENAGGITWGVARDIDRTAFVTMVQDLMNTHLSMADTARRGGMEGYELEVDDFLAQRFNENMTGWIQRERGAPSDSSGSANLTADVLGQVEASLTNAWKGTGRTITPAMSQEIANALSGVISEGGLGLDAVFNTDLFGLNVSDGAVARADSFLSEFYGGGDNWASNIKLGVQGSHKEMRRLADEAGVKWDQVDSQGRASPTLSEDTRMNMARLYFHLIDQNVGQGNIESTANHYANMVGYHTFGQNNFDDAWLSNVVRPLQLNPYSEQYGQTLEEQGMQRLEAMDTIEKRVMSAIDMGDLDRTTRTRAAHDVFSHLMPGGNRTRKSRFA